MSSTTQETGKKAGEMAVDLVSRIFAVDLSIARNFKLKPVGDGEQTVGRMSENLQKFYIIRHESFEEVERVKGHLTEIALEHKLRHLRGEKTDDCDAFKKKAEGMMEQLHTLSFEAALINDIFWDMVKLEFPEVHHKVHMGIRENYQVVWSEGGAKDPFLDEMIGGLMEILGRRL